MIGLRGIGGNAHSGPPPPAGRRGCCQRVIVRRNLTAWTRRLARESRPAGSAHLPVSHVGASREQSTGGTRCLPTHASFWIAAQFQGADDVHRVSRCALSQHPARTGPVPASPRLPEVRVKGAAVAPESVLLSETPHDEIDAFQKRGEPSAPPTSLSLCLRSAGIRRPY